MQAFPIRPYFYFRITRRGQTLYTCIDAKELRTHHVQAEAEQTSRQDVWDQFILFFSTEQSVKNLPHKTYKIYRVKMESRKQETAVWCMKNLEGA